MVIENDTPRDVLLEIKSALVLVADVLDAIHQEIKRVAGTIGTAEVKSPEKTKPARKTAPAPEEEPPVPEQEFTEEVKQDKPAEAVTHAQLAERVKAAATNGKRNELMEILTDVGAGIVSDIKPADLQKVSDKLKKLGY